MPVHIKGKLSQNDGCRGSWRRLGQLATTRILLFTRCYSSGPLMNESGHVDPSPKAGSCLSPEPHLFHHDGRGCNLKGLRLDAYCIFDKAMALCETMPKP